MKSQNNVIDIRLAMGRQGPDDTGEFVYEQGFDAVFRRYQGYVMTVIFRLVNNRALAEELTQETFLAVYQRFDTLDNPKVIRSWLCTIAIRQGMRHLKKQRRFWKSQTSSEHYMEIADESANSEQRMLVAQLFTLLDTIHVEAKTCWVLHVVEGVSYPETAQITGLSMRTVKRRVRTAKDMLEKHLEVIQ